MNRHATSGGGNLTAHLHEDPAYSQDGLSSHEQLHRLAEKARLLSQSIASLDEADQQPHTLIGLAQQAKGLIEEATLALAYRSHRPGRHEPSGSCRQR